MHEGLLQDGVNDSMAGAGGFGCLAQESGYGAW